MNPLIVEGDSTITDRVLGGKQSNWIGSFALQFASVWTE